jgi:23S rRNA pseudouridine955/2504/2580 synthase
MTLLKTEVGMQKFTVAKGCGGKRLDRVLSDKYPGTPAGIILKAIKDREVKVNGIRSPASFRLDEGDEIEVYISDEHLSLKPDTGFNIIYEDKNLIIVQKRQGVNVHSNSSQDAYNLEDAVKEHLRNNHERTELYLCHRIDRNTGGLVMLAKNRASLSFIIERMENRQIIKHYTCLLYGKLPREEDVLTAYLQKDSRAANVTVSDTEFPGSLKIITGYKVLGYADNVSLVEAEIHTGRTHQIRAHFAHIGNPVIGDGKYGRNTINKPLGASTQALWASRLDFRFSAESVILGYLSGKTFESRPDFAGLKNVRIPETAHI